VGNQVTVVFCYSRVKPSVESFYDYYLLQDGRNLVIIYSGTTKVC